MSVDSEVATPLSCFRLAVPPNAALSGDARRAVLEQAPYLAEGVRQCRFDEGHLEVLFAGTPPESFVEQLSGLFAHTARSFSKARLEVLFDLPGAPTHDADALPQLAASRQVIEIQPGLYSFQGSFLRVMQRLDEFLLRQSCDEGAIEQSHPTTVPVGSMVRNSYLASFPHHALLVSTIHRDLAQLEETARLLDDPQNAERALHRCQDSPRQMLAPTVCHRTFESLRGRSVADAGECYTAVAACHRNEGANVEGLARLQTFTMRELVLVGPPPFVEQGRQRTLQRCRAWLSAWGLRCRLATASDPFFAVANESKRAYQTLRGLKYELQVHLPHADRWIAAASFNNHQGTLVSAYDIASESGGPIHSGCIGYGYERLAYALHCQFGADPAGWPEPIRRSLAPDSPAA